jgi:hypothetical protein
MNMVRAAALGAAVLTLATTAAQAQSPQVPNASEIMRSPAYPSPAQQGEHGSRPLFTFGGIEAHLWAPVEPPYDPSINRPLAEVPLWDHAD